MSTAKKKATKKKSDKQPETVDQPINEDSGAENASQALGTIGAAPYAELMSENYLLFAVSTLLGRALPYIDGLKPVQRRILHSMDQSGLYYDRGTVKSALIVGEVMGKYHPHGDSSIYEALVRMSQSFSMRVPLIDGQGNFGNIDGDAAAAMRYTEARLSKAAGEIVADSHPQIVDRHMGRNYTEDLPEPGLLPARFPNLLINGATGIATGMTSVFLPHNPQEAMELCIWRLKNPDAADEEVIARISGPDFPTGAAVLKDQGLEEAYLTGKGRVTGVCQAHIEPLPGNREKVVITEIPWMVDKGKLLMDITKQYEKGDYPELTDLVDYSDKEIRIEAPLKRNVNAQAFLAKLMNNTALRRTYPVEMNVVIDGVPKTVTLPELIDHFLDFRREMVVNRAKKRIAEIEGRLYKLDAYLKVISAVDKVVAIIKKAKDRQAAKAPLQKLLKIDEQQAQWIVEMALGSLTQLDSKKLKDEAGELRKELTHWQKFIDDPVMVTDEMSTEFSELLKDWKKAGITERKTALLAPTGGEAPEGPESADSLVTTVEADDQPVLLLISANGKALCSTGTAQRGAAMKLGADDHLAVFAPANTNQEWLVFTDRGQVFRLRLAELPLESRKSSGMALDQLLSIQPGEKIVAAQQAVADSSFLTVSARGMVKRSSWSEVEKAHAGGIIAAKIADDDQLLAVVDVGDQDDICLLADNGKVLRFPASAARVMGRNAGGVRGMKLDDQQRVVGLAVFKPGVDGQQLLIATDRGFAKRLAAEEIPTKGRDGQGVMAAKPGGKYGQPVAGGLINDQDQVISEQGSGQTKVIAGSDIALVGRAIVVKSWDGGSPQRVFIIGQQ